VIRCADHVVDELRVTEFVATEFVATEFVATELVAAGVGAEVVWLRPTAGEKVAIGVAMKAATAQVSAMRRNRVDVSTEVIGDCGECVNVSPMHMRISIETN